MFAGTFQPQAQAFLSFWRKDACGLAPMAAASQDEIRRRQAEVRNEVRNLGKRKRRLERRSSAALALETINLPREALMVYLLADYKAGVAVDFLQGRGRSLRSEFKDHCHDDLVAWVETAYIETPLPVVRDLLDQPEADDNTTSAKNQRYKLQLAGRYVLEHALFQWTLNQNQVHGVAPSRDLLTSHALRIAPASLPPCARERLCCPLRSSSRTQRKWMRSFRRRWGARVGGLPKLKHLPQALVYNKVQGSVEEACRC